MNINYNILRQDRNGMFNIEMIGYINRVQYRWNTRIKVFPTEWNDKRQRHKRNPEVNSRLDELMRLATNYFLRNNPNVSEFKNYMDEQTGRKTNAKGCSFLDVMGTIADNSAKRTNANGELIGKCRVRMYKEFVKQLKCFESDTDSRLDFMSLNTAMLDKLKDWFTVTRQLAPNTLCSRFKMLKSMLAEARSIGYEVNKDIMSYRIKYVKSENVVLTQDEVNMMCEYECDSNRLQNVQDLFVIGVYTGLRFSDLSQLSDSKVHNDTLELHQKKTGGKVIIPLHPRVKHILETRGLPRIICSQKYNVYLRELAKLAGIDEIVEVKKTKGGKRIITETEKCQLISSHTCRRTFATFLYKNGVNPKLIMMLTGHKQLSTFMNYVILDNNDAINAVKDCWQRTSI